MEPEKDTQQFERQIEKAIGMVAVNGSLSGVASKNLKEQMLSHLAQAEKRGFYEGEKNEFHHQRANIEEAEKRGMERAVEIIEDEVTSYKVFEGERYALVREEAFIRARNLYQN